MSDSGIGMAALKRARRSLLNTSVALEACITAFTNFCLNGHSRKREDGRFINIKISFV